MIKNLHITYYLIFKRWLQIWVTKPTSAAYHITHNAQVVIKNFLSRHSFDFKLYFYKRSRSSWKLCSLFTIFFWFFKINGKQLRTSTLQIIVDVMRCTQKMHLTFFFGWFWYGSLEEKKNSHAKTKNKTRILKIHKIFNNKTQW